MRIECNQRIHSWVYTASLHRRMVETFSNTSWYVPKDSNPTLRFEIRGESSGRSSSATFQPRSNLGQKTACCQKPEELEFGVRKTIWIGNPESKNYFA